MSPSCDGRTRAAGRMYQNPRPLSVFVLISFGLPYVLYRVPSLLSPTALLFFLCALWAPHSFQYWPERTQHENNARSACQATSTLRFNIIIQG